MTVRVVIPGLRLVSEANERGAWFKGAKRAADQRRVVKLVLRTRRPPALPCVVRVVRVAPRDLDAGDNLSRAAKAVRDEIAAWLGTDDRDPRITWHVGQEKGGAREYAVRILVRSFSTRVPGARVRDEGERTVADVVLRPEDFAVLARRLAAVAEGRGTKVSVAVGEVSLVLRRTEMDAAGAAGGDAR